jgi:hypothetical protein
MGELGKTSARSPHESDNILALPMSCPDELFAITEIRSLEPWKWYSLFF